MRFTQIIEVTATDEQSLGDHVAGWQAEQHGLVPGCRGAHILANEDMPSRYLIEVDFSSREEAGRNNLRSETAAWAIKLAELTSGDPKFRNLRVVCTTGGCVMAARSSITAVLDGAPDMVFRTITDIARLPEWNAAMTKVVEAPAELEPGAEWVVEFHALGQRWRSRSRVEHLDAEGRRFAYRSWTDDGNLSYAGWSWEVAEDPAGSRVTVAWELHPVTFWRRVLLGRIRARQLSRRELPESLAALAAAAKAAEPRSNQGFV